MKKTTDVHQGTLALMVLKTLDVLGPLHGYGLARRIEQISGDRLTLNTGTLYPLLLRLEQEGAITSERGPSENNRSARFYRLTKAGRKQLEAETRAMGADDRADRAVLCREGEGSPVRRLRQWLIRLTTSMTRRHDETRLREEIDDHVAFETEANLRRGLPPAEARRRALLTFGSMETFKENYRDQQGVPPLEHLLQDVRMALRRMWKTPGFTVAAIATLALGLGLTSAVMSLAYALFLRPLPVDDAARVVFVEQTRVDRPGELGVFVSRLPLSPRARARILRAGRPQLDVPPMSVVTPGGPVSVSGAVVTANYFTLLRLTPRAGRFFSADEDRVPGRDPVAILGYDFWRTRFAEDPHVVGTTVRINGTAFTVIGIAPEHFHGIVAGLEPNAVWIPTAMFGVGVSLLRRAVAGLRCGRPDRPAGRATRRLTRRKPKWRGWCGSSKRCTPEAQGTTASWFARFAASGSRSRRRTLRLLRLLAAAAGLVLLVASANVAGLLLARGLRRRKEIAVRLAIGASRGRLIRLLLVESVMLAAAGGVAGLVIAHWATDGAASVLRRGAVGSPTSTCRWTRGSR